MQRNRRSSLRLGIFICSLVCAILAAIIGLPGVWISTGRPTNHDRILAEWGIPLTLPLSYLQDVPFDKSYSRLMLPASERIGEPDITAVILNWSRFSNVVLIASLLCKPELDSVISQVFIWNNNPKPIDLTDFAATACSAEKLRIYNSPANILFQARFMACAQSSTPYCFTQDDDYLIRPEIIRALRRRMAGLPVAKTIHLLPPHEHLSSQLREVHSANGALHTSFAWLGHGTMFPRSYSEEFLELLHGLNFTFEEMTMADNYFSVLKNEVPEVWFDQGIELGGGQPFTAGTEGDLRNRRHITRAAQYLDAVVNCEAPPCLPSASGERRVPYINTASLRNASSTNIVRAACAGVTCLLETNIRILLPQTAHIVDSAQAMLSVEERNAEMIGVDGKEHYLSHALSLAVDGRPLSSFISPDDARTGDFIHLDLLDALTPETSALEMVFFVDAGTEQILQHCSFQSSVNGIHWVQSGQELRCLDTSFEQDHHILRECYGSVPARIGTGGGVQHVRAFLQRSVDKQWRIHEVWVRGTTSV